MYANYSSIKKKFKAKKKIIPKREIMSGNEESLVHKESLVLLVGISFSYFTNSFVLFWLFAFSGAGPAAYGRSRG